jgi:hypothetical protein
MEHIQRQFDNKEAIVQQNDKTYKQVSKSLRGETSYVDEQKDKEKRRQEKKKQGSDHENHDHIQKKAGAPKGDANIIDITI